MYENNDNNELTDNDPPIWRHSMGGSLCLSSVDLKNPHSENAFHGSMDAHAPGRLPAWFSTKIPSFKHCRR